MKLLNHKPFPFSIPIILLMFHFNPLVAQESVVDKAIEASFTFRKHTYSYKRQNGQFTYTRIGKNKNGSSVRDVYTNKAFTGYIDDTVASITQKRKNAYTNSVNSVMYFAFLPMWLKDPAVVLENIGTRVVKDKEYHKIRVTFRKEGDGIDYEDVFLYCFDVDDNRMDYLAYKCFTDKGGMRFREAYNQRTVNGVPIQDYRNLQPKTKDGIPFEQIEKAFENGKLKELSTIELKDVKISTLPKT